MRPIRDMLKLGDGVGGDQAGGSNTVFVINTATNTVVATIPVGVVPELLARDASGGPSGPATQGSGTSEFAAIQAVAPSLRVEVNPVNMRDAGEIERAVAAFARSLNGGLIGGRRRAATSSRSDHHAGGPPQTARGLLRTYFVAAGA